MTESESIPQTAEIARLQDLSEFDFWGTPAEAHYDYFCDIATALTKCPIVEIVLIGDREEWVKARVGPQLAFCALQTQLTLETMGSDRNIVHEELASLDPWFIMDSEALCRKPEVRFFAGFPLTTFRGHRIGLLRVIDQKPRVMSAEVRNLLERTAAEIIYVMESERKINLATRDLRWLHKLVEQGDSSLPPEEFQSENHSLDDGYNFTLPLAS